MEETTDKVYMWMTILTFVAFLSAILCGVAFVNTYKDQSHTIEKNVF